MKSFTDFSERKAFLDDLIEYSIHEPKYGAGEQVVVKTDKINNPNLKIYSRKSWGLASAFLLGLINSTGDIVGWLDSNMDSLAAKLPDMISKLDNNDLVLLSRYVEGGKDERKGLRILSSRIVNLICRYAW